MFDCGLPCLYIGYWKNRPRLFGQNFHGDKWSPAMVALSTVALTEGPSRPKATGAVCNVGFMRQVCPAATRRSKPCLASSRQIFDVVAGCCKR